MDFGVRQLQAEDFRDIDTRLTYFRTLSNLTTAPGIPEEPCLKIYNRATKAGSIFYVATEGKEVVGAASLMIPEGFNTGYLEDVVTRDGFKGNGIMKSLLQKLISENSQGDIDTIVLDCGTSLKRFYESFGFKQDNGQVQVRYDLWDPSNHDHVQSYPGITPSCFIEPKFAHNGARVMHLKARDPTHMNFETGDRNFAINSTCYKVIATATEDSLKDWEKQGFKPKSENPEIPMSLKIR